MINLELSHGTCKVSVIQVGNNLEVNISSDLGNFFCKVPTATSRDLLERARFIKNIYILTLQSAKLIVIGNGFEEGTFIVLNRLGDAGDLLVLEKAGKEKWIKLGKTKFPDPEGF